MSTSLEWEHYGPGLYQTQTDDGQIWEYEATAGTVRSLRDARLKGSAMNVIQASREVYRLLGTTTNEP